MRALPQVTSISTIYLIAPVQTEAPSRIPRLIHFGLSVRTRVADVDLSPRKVYCGFSKESKLVSWAVRILLPCKCSSSHNTMTAARTKLFSHQRNADLLLFSSQSLVIRIRHPHTDRYDQSKKQALHLSASTGESSERFRESEHCDRFCGPG